MILRGSRRRRLSLNNCYLPTGFNPIIRSKTKQSKHKQRYQDLTIRVLLFFIFRFFTHSPICRLPFVFSLFLKGGRVNQKEKPKTKAPGNNVFTRKIQPQNQCKQSSSCFCSPFIGTVSNDVAAPKPEKEQRRRQK